LLILQSGQSVLEIRPPIFSCLELRLDLKFVGIFGLELLILDLDQVLLSRFILVERGP
jgi:hypothetical protein